VGSGIFKSEDPAPRAKAVVQAVLNFKDPKALADISAGLGEPMRGIDVASMKAEERMAGRGW
jgi:pyridoxal 5'-phosphate synthase pdxS subunit